MKKSNRKGFTIVELVIVIAVIAILAAVLIPTFSNLIKKANESSDIQAVREMNTFLTAEAILNGVDSILDVYDIFEASGFKVENFSPLVSGNEFFYDVELNQVLYVDEEGKVLFPKENKGKTQADLGHVWLSLSMSIGTELPTEFAVANNVMTAKVTNAKQYAYVIEQYNNAAEGTALNLTIDGTLDLQSATTVINETKGAVTITGTNNAVIKNITSNKFTSKSSNNSDKIVANYQAAALVANAKHNITISDVTFENLNVRVIDAGNVGLICGSTGKDVVLTLKGNVTIKNSTVIGARSVAALVGASGGDGGAAPVKVEGNLTLENVTVGTTQGRSALLVVTNSPKAMVIDATATITINNSSCVMYEAAEMQQVKTTEATYNNENVDHFIVDLNGTNVADYNIYALKSLDGTNHSFYQHKDNVLVLDYALNNKANTRTALMTVEELYAKYRVQ